MKKKINALFFIVMVALCFTLPVSATTKIDGDIENSIVTPYSLYHRSASATLSISSTGLATATDVFAHSAFESTSSGWARIKHPNADDTTYLNNRVRMTYDIMQNIVDRHNGDRSGINYCHDFHDAVTDAYYNTVTFKVNKLKSFSEDAGVTNSTILSDYDKIS